MACGDPRKWLFARAGLFFLFRGHMACGDPSVGATPPLNRVRVMVDAFRLGLTEAGPRPLSDPGSACSRAGAQRTSGQAEASAEVALIRDVTDTERRTTESTFDYPGTTSHYPFRTKFWPCWIYLVTC